MRIHEIRRWAAVLLTIFWVAGSILQPVYAEYPLSVLPGGMPFGVKFLADGIVVAGFTEIETESGFEIPAYDAGIRINDIITEVNGIDVNTAAELMDIVEDSDNEISITVLRGGNEEIYSVRPACGNDGRMKTGMWIRDTTAGIGTVTYINPESGEFGGLGHGICDPGTGELIEIEKGIIVEVQISGVNKGKTGTPGELKGYFSKSRWGAVIDNTHCGVFGILGEIPEAAEGNLTSISPRESVREGTAFIRCTLEGSAPHEYEVRIEDINYASRDNRSFTVVVTDQTLIEQTGGIVQGMSGSPILQDGKLVGAVTHVLINDPTRGYGIFIENMLEEAE